jgi:DUF971 family protein
MGKLTTMKNFEEREKQVKEIFDRVKKADFIDTELENAYNDIMKLVRQAYRDGHDDGMQNYAYIQEKSQEMINNLFKN